VCSSDLYILIADSLIGNVAHTDSPIYCGDCNNPKPLYKLPKIFNETDYYTVRQFERESRAIEQMWISGFDDKLTNRLRTSRNSNLVKKGRTIAKTFEDKSRTNFYYNIPITTNSNVNCPYCNGGIKIVRNRCYCDDCRITWEKE
jgi:predicted  nucleic acid-binding Zn ribbon protein